MNILEEQEGGTIFANDRRTMESMIHALAGLGWKTKYLAPVDECRHPSGFFAWKQDEAKTKCHSVIINYDYPDDQREVWNRCRKSRNCTLFAFFTYADRKYAKDLIGLLELLGQFIEPKLVQLEYTFRRQQEGKETDLKSKGRRLTNKKGFSLSM